MGDGAQVEGADGFPIALAALENQLQALRATIVALKLALPFDPGRQRPFGDERRLIRLADIFEAAGGKATAYLTAYAEAGSMADTDFRRFAQLFYSLFPDQIDKRDPGGLDDALRRTVTARRIRRSATSGP